MDHHDDATGAAVRAPQLDELGRIVAVRQPLAGQRHLLSGLACAAPDREHRTAAEPGGEQGTPAQHPPIMTAGSTLPRMAATEGFERLDAAPVRATVAQLDRRIATRFPTRGLRKVVADLVQMADEVADNARDTQRRLRSVQLLRGC